MPSWPDGEYSSPELSDLTPWDYAPATCKDTTFEGIAMGYEAKDLCAGHKKERQRCVTFEGSNTGRRFYMCPIENQVENCGFVSWVDGEWPEACQNALKKLWSMYHESNIMRIDEKIQNGNVVEYLNKENAKLKRVYNSLHEDVKKFCDDTERSVIKENMRKMNEENAQLFDMNGPQLEQELIRVNNEVAQLKQVQKYDEELRKLSKNQWEKERERLKESKKRIEYQLYDLLKVSEANKEKIKQIKGQLKQIEEICGEE